jgi:uncharacterized membrane protein
VAAFLLSVHVLAAIVFIGPVTVAVSLFPRYARQALAHPAGPAVPIVHVLHRISRVYAVLALAVPVFGVATAVRLDALTDAWVLISVALTLAAAAILGTVVLPRQVQVRAVVEELAAATQRRDPRDSPDPGDLPDSPDPRTSPVAVLAMAAGTFNLLWAVVVILMIVRPGSTTGA